MNTSSVAETVKSQQLSISTACVGSSTLEGEEVIDVTEQVTEELFHPHGEGRILIRYLRHEEGLVAEIGWWTPFEGNPHRVVGDFAPLSAVGTDDGLWGHDWPEWIVQPGSEWKESWEKAWRILMPLVLEHRPDPD